MVKSIKSVDVQSLPPTSHSAKYHPYRVYYQTQVWMGNQSLKPEEWGWKVHCGNLVPMTMDSNPAPDELMKILRCRCKGLCDTLHCTCKKNNLHCTSSCFECHEGFCINLPEDEDISITDDPDIIFC